MEVVLLGELFDFIMYWVCVVCIWVLFDEFFLIGGEELLNVWDIFFIVVVMVEYLCKLVILL